MRYRDIYCSICNITQNDVPLPLGTMHPCPICGKQMIEMPVATPVLNKQKGHWHTNTNIKDTQV